MEVVSLPSSLDAAVSLSTLDAAVMLSTLDEDLSTTATSSIVLPRLSSTVALMVVADGGRTAVLWGQVCIAGLDNKRYNLDNNKFFGSYTINTQDILICVSFESTE